MNTYSLLPSLSSRNHQRIMILLNVQIQKQIRREILPTFNAPIHMCLSIMDLIIHI